MPSYSGVWNINEVFQAVGQDLWPYSPTNGPIGLFAGGSSVTNVINRIIISTAGDATDFGDLTVARYNLCAFGSNIRGVWAGGEISGLAGGRLNTIDYVTYTTAGDATDFGDLSVAKTEVVGASNNVRGLVFVGFSSAGSYLNVIEYVTISSTGNTTDFGDALNALRRTNTGGLASSTRAVIAGGFDASLGELNVIQYVTIASTGNATDFGDLLATTKQAGGAASETRGLFAGGYAPSAQVNVIQYITIATTGNATDFGDLTIAAQLSGVASSTRAVFGGYGNTLAYVTIASAGNAIDFGDLTNSITDGAACSNAADAVQLTPTSAAMALFGGGTDTTNTQASIQYVNIATTGNAMMFGELSAARYYLAACASSTRGLFGGGVSFTNVIDYVTFSSFGLATSFGQLTTSSWYNLGGLSNETRGIWFGGSDGGSSYTNVIQYVTIASAGNGTDFGDLTVGRQGVAGAASTTRGVMGGGAATGNVLQNVIDYITIASVGNATDFGDLVSIISYPSSCSSSTRALFGGGSGSVSNINVIQYITIASTGDTTDFGDLSAALRSLSATSSSVRGVFAGGLSGPVNVIQYVTIDTTGDAVDFGDLAYLNYGSAGCSNAHGGL
jgi:hypothetical protein